MFALLATVCMLGSKDCTIIKVADKFPEQKVCSDLAQVILPAWVAKHKDSKVLGWLCTDSPSYYLYAFEA